MFARDPKTAKIGDELLPLELGYLPEFFRQKGEAELNYTPSLRQKSLWKLKEVIKDDSTLKKHEFSDELLLLFLNSRKYDLHKTKAQLKTYIKFKNSYLFVYINIKFDVLEPFMSSELINILPWRCQDGCAIVVVQLGNHDFKKHPTVAFKQIFAVILTQLLRYPMTEVNGFKVIFDLNMSNQTLKICTPQNLHQLYCGAVKVLPGRIKGYHAVNMGVAGRTAYQIIKVFLSEKVKKRLHIHASLDTILDFFPKAILPEKLGGDLKEYDKTAWLKKMTSPEELAVLNILSN